MDANIKLNDMVKIAEKYGFRAKIINGYKHWNNDLNTDNHRSVQISAKNTDNRLVTWFLWDSVRDVLYGDNTDQCNIWLCNTRPDLTPEQLISFFTELCERAALKTLVDPEDWQEIADVRDAYEDERYIAE